MILKDFSEEKSFFDVVVCFCFMDDGRMPVFKKNDENPLYGGLIGFVAGKKKLIDKCIRSAVRREFREETGNLVGRRLFVHLDVEPTIHCGLNGQELCFCANIFYLPERFGLKKIRINKEEHKGYEIYKPEEILAIPKKEFIPDAYESFQNFYERIIKRAV